jgi:hypothetical protein
LEEKGKQSPWGESSSADERRRTAMALVGKGTVSFRGDARKIKAKPLGATGKFEGR